MKSKNMGLGILLLFIFLLLLGAVALNRNAFSKLSQEVELAKDEQSIIYPDPTFKVKWDVKEKNVQVFHNTQLLQQFDLPEQPLAIWLKKDTGTMIIATSEDEELTSNQILYLAKNNAVQPLYHAVSGYDPEKGIYPRRFFAQKSNPVILPEDDVILTPREELVVAREYQNLGAKPLVIFTASAGLTSYTNYWDRKSLYWSPDGRCYLHWGVQSEASGETQDEFGYFQTPRDFVSYTIYSSSWNRRELQIRWVEGQRCEGYISMVADVHATGEGATEQANQQFYYHFGETVPEHLQEIKELPKNFNQLKESKQIDQQLIYVKY